MNRGDDPRADELIVAYLAHLRGEASAPDAKSFDTDDGVAARKLFELLDAVADMGRELPLFEDDPLANRLSHRRPVVTGGRHHLANRLDQGAGVETRIASGRLEEAPTPLVPPHRSAPRKGVCRRTSFGLSRSVWGVAAVLTLVLLMATSLVLVDRSSPAGAVQVGPLTSECATTFMGSQAAAVRDEPRVVVAATWAGEERRRFEQVLGRFADESGIDVAFATHDANADRDLGETLRRLEQQGCAPDVALLPQPGLLTELARNDRLTPLDANTIREVSRNYSPAWQEMGEVDGTPYGVWFKAANKSIIWYNANAFAKAGIERPPNDWEGLKDAAEKLYAVGIAPFAVAGGGDDGWVLSDWFENVYLRTAGPDNYDDLAVGTLPWTDPTVKGALARLAEIFGREEWLAGGTAGSLQLTYEQSIRKVFGNPDAPEAAMVFEGDFVANEVAETESTLGVDAQFFRFPLIGQYEPTVVGTGIPPGPGEAGGDVAVAMTDTDTGRRLLRYLASAAAAEPWVRLGGFVSPNKKVDLDHYPDAVIRQAAEELVQAESLRFDLSDMLDPAFGSRPGQGMWKVLRDFLATPSNIDGTAQRLEEEYQAAG